MQNNKGDSMHKTEAKLIKITLLFLLDGAKTRWKVTAKLKNYEKKHRESAIRYMMQNKLVSLYEIDGTKGRNPVMIKLTDAGIKEAESYNASPIDKTVWSI
jgi:hypothetical protein